MINDIAHIVVYIAVGAIGAWGGTTIFRDFKRMRHKKM